MIVFSVPGVANPQREVVDPAASSAHFSAAESLLIMYYGREADLLRVRTAYPVGSEFLLEPVLDIPGASASEPATHHYVVWTDVVDGWESELDAWYREEHLAGLAAVPGAVRARLYHHHGSAPRSYACYDLTDADVNTRSAWLAARATARSSQVRPNFLNTRRTMFRTLGARHASAEAGVHGNRA